MTRRMNTRGKQVVIIDGDERQVLGHYRAVFFYDTMRIVDSTKQGYTVRIRLVSEIDGTEYTMLFPELMVMLTKTKVEYGKATGIWGFVKHGDILGLQFFREDTPKDKR